MYRTLAVAAIAAALSAAALGQSNSRRPALNKPEAELIAMSRAFVDTEVGKDIVAVTDRVSPTPSGLMGVAEVKGRWDSVELETPVVRIKGGEGVVTGRVVFKGRSQEGRAINQGIGIRIR